MITPQYLAGLIDGEGYLGILPVRSKETINPCFEPVIKIGMTGETAHDLFLEILETYGGYLEAHTRMTAGKRIAYTYYMKGKKRIPVLLTLLLPYLRVKHSQALILIEFCELPYQHPKSPQFDASVPLKRVELYEQLKAAKLPEPFAQTK